MKTDIVVEIEVGVDSLSSVGECLVMHEVDILIFQGSPQALREYVVHASSPAVHADINPVILDPCGEGIAGKLGPLVTGVPTLIFDSTLTY